MLPIMSAPHSVTVALTVVREEMNVNVGVLFAPKRHHGLMRPDEMRAAIATFEALRAKYVKRAEDLMHQRISNSDTVMVEVTERLESCDNMVRCLDHAIKGAHAQLAIEERS